jgi:steroid delta-isomerase-like uncharacterized protein
LKSNIDLVQKYYTKFWNEYDKTLIDELFHDEIVFHSSLGIEIHGKKELENYFDMILQGIPNLYHSIETIIADEKGVAVRAVYNGTHKGELLGNKATNKRIRYHGASFFTIQNNKIIKIWVLGDINSLLKQIEN